MNINTNTLTTYVSGYMTTVHYLESPSPIN